MIEANSSASDALKHPSDSKMINVARIKRASEGLPNVGLSCEVIDLIGLYSSDRSGNRLVLRKLQRYSLDGLR